jgi:hypothetical protein
MGIAPALPNSCNKPRISSSTRSRTMERSNCAVGVAKEENLRKLSTHYQQTPKPQKPKSTT